MAASNIGNTAGAVNVFDGESPRIIGGRAKEGISGGVLVFASGADDVVSSGLNSFVSADIQFARDASGGNFNGINLFTIGSNDLMSVATRGSFILVSNGTVTASQNVLADGNNSVANGTTAGRVIGRALTSSASGGHAIIDITG